MLGEVVHKPRYVIRARSVLEVFESFRNLHSSFYVPLLVSLAVPNRIYIVTNSANAVKSSVKVSSSWMSGSSKRSSISTK